MKFIKKEDGIYLKDDNKNIIAEINFEKKNKDTYNIYHTFVDDSLRGQGIASKLVEEAVKEIKKRGCKVEATCSYAKAWLEKHKWTKEKYDRYIKELFKQKDEKYAKFHEHIINTNYKIVGIRVPILQKEAKELSKDYEGFLEVAEDNTYEEVMLYGLVISNIKDYKEYVKYLKKYIKLIDSWALVDSFVPKSKVIEKNLEENWELVKKLTKSKKEFESRVGYIMILNYYIDNKYLDEVFEMMNNNTNTTYYNEMAIAWLLAEILTKDEYYKKAVKYLKSDCKLDKFTKNKAIQKARESFRITKEQKEELLKYKIKE